MDQEVIDKAPLEVSWFKTFVEYDIFHYRLVNTILEHRFNRKPLHNNIGGSGVYCSFFHLPGSCFTNIFLVRIRHIKSRNNVKGGVDGAAL